MNFAPAIRIRTESHLRSLCIFFPVVVVIMLVICTGILFSQEGRSGSVSSTSVSVAVFAFVLGICSVREDMRLLSQFGFSRPTGFITRLVSALILAIVGAVASQLLLALCIAVAAEGLEVSDLYQIIYMQENMTMGLGDHLLATAMNASMILALFEFGETFSLAFLRTNKAGTVALGIFIGLCPFAILPALFSIPAVMNVVGPAVAALFRWMGAGVGNLIAALLIWTLVGLVVNYLLMRRAPIRPAKA